MKWFMFCVAMNFIAAIVLIGAGATELNNLGTSVPALLCIAAGICGLIEIRKKQVMELQSFAYRTPLLPRHSNKRQSVFTR